MNKKYAKVQSTRRSLIMSILSLMLCFAMLIGTTYAWFTDSVTSGRNKIVAGNLDVELYHSKTLPVSKTAANSVADATDLFGIAKWEPGVIAYENFMVSNVGTLALKYAMTLNIYDKNAFKGHDLSEVIKVAVIDGGFDATGDPVTDRAAAQALDFETLADFQKQGNLVAGADATPYGIVLYWEPTDNDNLYNVNNGQKTDDNGTELFIEFGINLVATQDTVESDSFDNQYDKTASYELNFAKMTKKLKEDGTEDLKVKKTGIIEEAKVPAKAANAVFDALSAEAPAEFKKEDGTTLKDDVSQEMVLTLDVEDKGAKNNKQTFNIDMTAVMTFTEGAKTETVTKNVTNLSDFVYVDVQVEKGLVIDGVKHNDKDMKNAATPDGTNDDNGYYNYKATEGLLRLIMKSFSPFTMTWQELQVVTPTSTPVSGTISGTTGSFSNGKYETILATSGATKGLHYLDVVFNNANPGDILYLTFDETPTVGIDVGSPNQYKTHIVIDGTNITPTDKTAKIVLNQGESHILSIMQTEANKVSIKIDHQELPVIVAQPTAANPMVAATGEDLHYQWCKENSTVVDNDTQKAVYAEGNIDDSFGYYTKTTFEDNKWKCVSNDSRCLIITLHNVSAGDIVSFNAENGMGTKVVLSSVDGNTDFYKLEQAASSYSVQIPEGANGSCNLMIGFTGDAFAGTVSIQELTPIANGTGPKLETTEAGTYFCKVSNRVGTVISDKVTIN